MTTATGLHSDPEALQVPELRLKHGEDRRINAGHPWVFSHEVDTARTPLATLAPGAQVRLLSDRDKFLGYAYVNPHSLISARIMLWERKTVRPTVGRRGDSTYLYKYTKNVIK